VNNFWVILVPTLVKSHSIVKYVVKLLVFVDHLGSTCGLMIQEHLSGVNCAVNVLGGVKILLLTLVNILERSSTHVRFVLNVLHVKGFFWFIIKPIQIIVSINVKIVLEVSEQKGTS
jgi:hypothetical protein